jgi:hypothetical protein
MDRRRLIQKLDKPHVSRATILREKSEKSLDRKDRTICVKLMKKLEKSVLAEKIPQIHSEIEAVFFPRQKIPR